MGRPLGCHCNTNCGCQCPADPIVLHEWTGGIEGLSLNFRTYDAWHDNRLDHLRKRGVQYIWEVMWTGGTYSGPITNPGVPQGCGLIYDGRHRTGFPSLSQFGTTMGIPNYPALVVGVCPNLTLEMQADRTAYPIDDVEFQLRVKCLCCSSGRSFANSLTPPTGLVGLWDGMHRDEPEFCRPDIGAVSHNALCKPEIVYFNRRDVGFSIPQRLITIYGDDVIYWTSWIHQFAGVPTESEYTFGTSFWSGDLTRAEVLWLSPHADPDTVHGTVQPILDWLSIGGKVLVIDGGYLQPQVMSDLGFATNWSALPIDPGNTSSALTTGAHPLVSGVPATLMQSGTIHPGYSPALSATVLAVDASGNPLVSIEPYLGSWVITTCLSKPGTDNVAKSISELGEEQFIRNIYEKRHLF